MIINERLPLWPVKIFVCAQAHFIPSLSHHYENTLINVYFNLLLHSLTPLALSPQVKPSCKTVPNGKITPTAKHRANVLGKKTSAEEKERGKEKEKEKEERNEKEEKKEDETSEESRAEEQAFLVSLYKYMKDRDTPIERIPFLGFKQSE